ncbi:hypothetical protein [Dyadobacter psychrotolerans]|uniref:Uncharacterized protein n=1 Tax=Dyadobacter psychrotolerans TaxID=2541721 RepID=A0A4R5DWA9_9BACT|nr:hypothetical protein [Dyadobacter psychrotolerans]TDE15555.1 hypothetical protein E0F88_13715 [Dyadobacter psychrotolerans]
MRKLSLLIACGFILFIPTHKVLGQLTVFNVSSSDITDVRKISIQQQFEIQDQIESSTTLTYGLGKKWEVGLNLINLDYSAKNKHFEINDSTIASPFAPLLLANAQKVFELNQIWSVGLGAVAGTNLSHFHPDKFVYYGYTNLVASLGDHDRYKFAAGPYISNHRYLSDGAVYGFQGAVDAGLFYKKLHFLADWISGTHKKGKLSLGIEAFLLERLPLSFGWQRSNSDGAKAAVVQLTFLPK